MPAGDRFDRYLLTDERRVLEFTYHWMYLTKPVATFAGALVLGAALVAASDGATLAWVILVGALVWFGLPLLSAIENRHAVRLIITDSRVVFVEGWLAKRYGMMPLTKITDLTIHEPIIGRILGYGTIIAESAGQDQALTRIHFLPEPLRAWQTISDLLYVQGAGRPGYRRPLPEPFPGPEPTTPSPR